LWNTAHKPLVSIHVCLMLPTPSTYSVVSAVKLSVQISYWWSLFRFSLVVMSAAIQQCQSQSDDTQQWTTETGQSEH